MVSQAKKHTRADDGKISYGETICSALPHFTLITVVSWLTEVRSVYGTGIWRTGLLNADLAALYVETDN